MLGESVAQPTTAHKYGLGEVMPDNYPRAWPHWCRKFVGSVQDFYLLLSTDQHISCGCLTAELLRVVGFRMMHFWDNSSIW